MTPLGAQKRLKETGAHVLVLETQPARRIFAFLLFCILLISLIQGIKPETDFSGRRLVGTLFFLSLLGTACFFTLYTWRLVFNKKKGAINERKELLSFAFSEKLYPVDSIRAVLLKRVILIPGKSRREMLHEGRSFPLSGLTTIRRRELASLELVFNEDTFQLDSSTDAGLLEGNGEKIAAFLDVPFKRIDEK